MAKRILVNEGSKIKTISNVTKLVTRLQNGNMCTWVPEDELLLATKTIVKDGTYKAASEAGSLYGYSQVTVNGVGTEIMGELSEKSITKNGTYRASEDKDGPFYGYSKVYVGVSGGGGGGGGGEPSAPITGKDDDDDDAMAQVDEDGNVVVTKLPDSIQVVTPPTLTVYEDGQMIDFHGIEVKAYLPDGTEWGTVNNLELSFPEPIAEYSESGTDRSMYHNLPIPSYMFDWPGRTSRTKRIFSFNRNVTDYYVFIVSPESDDSVFDLCYLVDCTNYNTITLYFKDYYPANSTRLVFEKTVSPNGYYYNNGIKWGYFRIQEFGKSVNPSLSYDIPFYYGDINDFFTNCQQTIPVQWHRPGDKKSLYGSFTITVNKPEDSGGQDPEPAPTPSPD